MKNLAKLKVILLAFIIVFTSSVVAEDKILPLPKPSIDQDIKIKTAKKKEIYPEKKPDQKKVDKKIDTSLETNEGVDVAKEESVIYPKKKPLLVKKKIDKAATKSEILSKRDFKIAKTTFEFVDKKKWQSALKTSQKAKDKTLYNLIKYLYLKQPSNTASFYDYVSFINSNPNYPRINRLRYLAEHKINLNVSSPKSIIKWFGEEEPLSDFGKIKLGEIYIIQGDIEKGSKLLKEGWIKAKLSKSNLKYLRKKYKKIITVEDNIK